MNNEDMISTKLLSLGGKVAHVVKFAGGASKRMLENGRFFVGHKIITLNDQPFGACHDNSVYVWANNINQLKICTGYAMDNNVWYRHTWCVDNEGTIYECTPRTRGAYYGVILNLQESKIFAREVLLPPELEELEGKLISTHKH